MYTYVNILYSVNKELNWIELNWSYATGLELSCCITEIPMDNAVDMVEPQSLGW